MAGSSSYCLLLAAIAVFGCARAADEPFDPSPVSDTGHGETGRGDGGGDGSSIDAKGDTKPIFDSELSCGDIGVVNTCDLVNDLGSIALGAKTSIAGNVPLAGGDVWYKATFASLGDPSAHPHVVIETPEAGAGFRFEIVRSCARDTFACSAEDASSTTLTDFEGSYQDASAADDSDAFVPISLGDGGVVYIRVFRTGGTPTDCLGFKLDLSN